MKQKFIVIISKDATPKSYLPIYGNKFWKTPNIDFLAKEGVVFNNFYTSASSTGMSFYSMITGQLPYLTKRKNYADETPFVGKDIFEKLHDLDDFESYFIWNKPHIKFLKKHLTVLSNSKNVNIITLDLIRRATKDKNVVDYEASNLSGDYSLILEKINLTFKEIKEKGKNVFIWLHLPHVIAPRFSYCSDIDIFDDVVGLGIKTFGKESIFIFSDHGNMNGKNGIYNYGFDVDQDVVNIPLICPNIGNLKQHKDDFISNSQLFEILTGNITKQEFLICDTAYYQQRLRSIAIFHNKYKLVYIKERNKFALYDVEYDPEERFNLLNDYYYDGRRQEKYFSKYLFFYPYWSQIENEKVILLKKFKEIYKKGPWNVEFKNRLINVIRNKQNKKIEKKFAFKYSGK